MAFRDCRLTRGVLSDAAHRLCPHLAPVDLPQELLLRNVGVVLLVERSQQLVVTNV
jgi:hypothetical protein